MGSAEMDTERPDEMASVETHKTEEHGNKISDDNEDKGAAARGGAGRNGAEAAARDACEVAPVTPSDEATAAAAQELKRKRSESDAARPEEGDDADEYAKQFSRAQLNVKVKRARLEANIAVQDEIKTLRFALLKAEQTAQEKERECEHAEMRYETLRESLDDIVKQHQRTLNGMRDNIKLENLVASLDKEKASKDALRDAFEKQNAELLRAQQRIEALDKQITQYQKTETVLAESISHFQHQFSSKDQERAATIERVRQTLEAQHQDTRRALEDEVQRLTVEKDTLQAQLQELWAEHAVLEESAHAVLELQEKRQGEESELRARVAQLETEKAVLVSKVEQVQKADAQLRGKIKTHEEQLLKLQQDNELLRSENVELAAIANDLMEMAESQQKQKQEILQLADDEGDERLARTRTRLRESLG